MRNEHSRDERERADATQPDEPRVDRETLRDLPPDEEDAEAVRGGGYTRDGDCALGGSI